MRCSARTLTSWQVIATFIYAVIGYAGYLMFGSHVSDEVSYCSISSAVISLTVLQVSRDLLSTPGYNHYLNQAALWMLVISPLSKFALCTRPVSLIFRCLVSL